MASANTVKMKAIETIKYGDNGEVAQPGDTFLTTEASAAQLLELGHATKASGGFAPSQSGDRTTGPLPDDFPGRAALADAHINTYAQIRKIDDPSTIPGVGEATADKIADALKGTS